MAIAKLALSAARALSSRLSGNIARRATRVEAAGNANKATERFRELQQQPRPKTRNEWLKRAAELNRLDNAKGTHAKTAAKVAQREAQREANASLRQRSSDVNTRVKMSREELIDAARLARADVRRKIREVRKVIGNKNFASSLAEEAADNLNLKGSRNQILSDLTRLEKVKRYKTLTIEGAQRMEDAGVEAFGEEFGDMTNEQKSAVWRKAQEIAIKESLSSLEVQAMIKAILKGKIKPIFTRKENPDGLSYLVVDFGNSLQDAMVQKAKRETAEELLAQYIRNGDQNPHFEGLEEIKDKLTNLFG